MIEVVIISGAAIAVAALAHDFGRKYLAYRASLIIEKARMDQFELTLEEHKKLHEKAISNFVNEVRETVGAIQTKTSMALDKPNGPTRVGRFGR